MKVLNSKLISAGMHDALNLLSKKTLPAGTAWAVADLQDAIQKARQRYTDLITKIFERHGAVRTRTGYEFTPEKPAPKEALQEIDDLLKLEIDLQIEPIPLPEVTASEKPIEYEPAIMIELRDFLRRKNDKG